MLGMTQTSSNPSGGRPASAPGAAPAPSQGGPPQIQRQFVNFAFFKINPAFRQCADDAKWQARSEFLKLFQTPWQNMMCLTYSTTGLKADCDFVLWRISSTPDAFQDQQATINKSRLGGFLTMPHSFLSMTKRSMYIDKLDPFHTAESRTHIIPGKRKYLFIYPFVKSREWYLLPLEKRQEIMDVHIKAGNKYPSVKLHTTYSYGLDAQDYVVAFETEDPKHVLDLLMEQRETQSSVYTVRDTPIFTCIQMPMERILDQLF
jgi:chlorite dismutase